MTRFFLNLLAGTLKLGRKRETRSPDMPPRILVIRRNRMGDMIYTLPLLHALRRHHPHAHITVACDRLGEPIALACPSVNDVIVLDPGWNPWQAAYRNASFLQDYDWAIAAKGGFDRRLAFLTKLTNAAVRIGFEMNRGRPSLYYTDPVERTDKADTEHQIETLLRLLQPLGLAKTTALTVDLTLHLPDTALAFAAAALAKPPFDTAARMLAINLSSTVKLKFREEDFIALARQVLARTDFAIALVAAPHDQQKAREIAMCMSSKRIAAIETPGPLELAAVLTNASLFLTPEGGAAHLAAAVGTPAVVLWSEGPFEKWRSRGKRHVFIKPPAVEKNIAVEEVWRAMQPFLVEKEPVMDEPWGDVVELPPSSDFVP